MASKLGGYMISVVNAKFSIPLESTFYKDTLKSTFEELEAENPYAYLLDGSGRGSTTVKTN